MYRFPTPSAAGLGQGPHWRKFSSTTLHVTGIALVAVSVGLLACTLLEVLTTGRDTAALALSTLLAGTAGAVLWYLTRPGTVGKRQIFATVAWTWVLTTGVGAVPYVLAGTFATGGAGFVEQVVNSVFESASGFSCTGSTVMADFDNAGRGLMMYRQLTQWYGGMGVVVLAVSVLPFLGVGGLDLISAEAPGPNSDRLTPRVSETARRLWIVYAGFTALAAVALFAADGFSSVYDAVAHAFTVASTGGFSVYPDSIGHYGSVAVETVVIVFMILGGASFTLHWRAVATRRLPHCHNSEFRAYLLLLGLCSAAVAALLWATGGLSPGSSLRAGVFNAVSLGTSTGFGNASGPGSAGDYVAWVAGAQLVLLLLMVVGGCTGSTAGGIKVMRMQVLAVVMVRSLRQAQAPRAVIPVRFGRDLITEGVVSQVAGFFLLHFLLVIGGLLVVTALGGELETSLGAVVSALGNMGPALGEAGPTANYADAFSQPARLSLALLMIIGRLEILPILLAVVPHVYRARALTRVLRR
ncbi:MAG: TrkH family potassium uptake protein [Acidimicrobiia bacterium]|nr:TrkH family potassium uptake protein [Acidimicrobiia bacterium]